MYRYRYPGTLYNVWDPVPERLECIDMYRACWSCRCVYFVFRDLISELCTFHISYVVSVQMKWSCRGGGSSGSLHCLVFKLLPTNHPWP